MQIETKICQNCQKEFPIEPEDFLFYQKIKVPPPTWCPECRMTRRMIWRNERTLYKRKCDAPGHDEELISVYSTDKNFKVYDQKYWWSDDCDFVEYGKNYDFEELFFVQFNELIQLVPSINLFVRNNINSPYVNYFADSKNSYMVIGGKDAEDTIYSNHIFSIKNSSDLYFVDKAELSYENLICKNSYHIFYSQNCENCMNSYFLYDCKNCSDCFGCVGLRNKSYCIFNKQYSKTEYEEKLKNFNLNSFSGLNEQKKIFDQFKLSYPRKFINANKTIEVSGDNILEAKNCKYAFDVLSGGSENSKFIFWSGQNMKDVYDGVGIGVQGEMLYEDSIVTLSVFKVMFSVLIWT
ncbi:MAG: hypothetical protein AAB693_02165, partial [Patescibacteria group bacterium]